MFEQIKASIAERNEELKESALGEWLVRDDDGEPVTFMGMNILEGTVRTLSSRHKEGYFETKVRIFLARDIDWNFDVGAGDSWGKERYGEENFTALTKLYMECLTKINKHVPSVSDRRGYHVVRDIFSEIVRRQTDHPAAESDLTLIVSHGSSDLTGKLYVYVGGKLEAFTAEHILREYRNQYFSELPDQALMPVVFVACSGDQADVETHGFPIVYSGSGKMGDLHNPKIVFKR